MKRQRLILLLAGAAVLGGAGDAHAIVGSLLRKSVTTATRKSAPVVGKGLVRAGAATASRRAGQAAATRSAVVVSKTGAIASRKVLDTFGIEGARAMSRLSPKGVQQLAEVSTQLAKSPHRQGWLKLIAQRGDRAVAWLWKRKGCIAVGTGAAAVLLAPEEFIAATEKLTAKAMEVAGEHVARPVVTATANALTAPLGDHVAQHGRGLATIAVRLGLLGGLLAVVYFRVWRRPAPKPSS